MNTWRGKTWLCAGVLERSKCRDKIKCSSHGYWGGVKREGAEVGKPADYPAVLTPAKGEWGLRRKNLSLQSSSGSVWARVMKDRTGLTVGVLGAHHWPGDAWANAGSAEHCGGSQGAVAGGCQETHSSHECVLAGRTEQLPPWLPPGQTVAPLLSAFVVVNKTP